MKLRRVRCACKSGRWRVVSGLLLELVRPQRASPCKQLRRSVPSVFDGRSSTAGQGFERGHLGAVPGPTEARRQFRRGGAHHGDGGDQGGHGLPNAGQGAGARTASPYAAVPGRNGSTARDCDGAGVEIFPVYDGI